MQRCTEVVVGVIACAFVAATWAAEGTWDLRAEFVGLKPGNAAVAIRNVSMTLRHLRNEFTVAR